MSSKYMIGCDTAPPKGDRCALSIGLTMEEFMATKRAQIPPGDERGQKILLDIDRIQKDFQKKHAGAICSVFVLSEKS